MMEYHFLVLLSALFLKTLAVFSNPLARHPAMPMPKILMILRLFVTGTMAGIMEGDTTPYRWSWSIILNTESSSKSSLG